MSKRLRKKAEDVRRAGEENSRGEDTVLAHITEDEAEILRLLGGSGRIDPETGLMHFDGSENEGSSYGAGDSTGTYGGESGPDETGGYDPSQYTEDSILGGLPSWDTPEDENSITSSWGLGPKGNMGRGNPSLSPTDPTSGLQSSWSLGLQNWLGTTGIYTGTPTTPLSNIEPGKDITGPVNLGGVGARGGVVDDVGAYLSENPAIDTALSILLGLANPALGIGYNALSNIARGNYGLGIGGLVGLANPSAGRVAAQVGNVIDKGPRGAINTAFDEATRAIGVNPGQQLTDMLGIDPTSRAGMGTSIAGNLAAQYGVDQLGQMAGSSWSGLGLGGESMGPAAEPGGGDSATMSAMSVDSFSPSQVAFSGGGGGGTVGMDDQRKRLRDVIGSYTPASNLSKFLSPRQQQMLMEQQNG